MFLSRDDKDARFLRLQASYQDPLTEVHLSFYTSSLTIFTRYNKFLQRSYPLTHKVYLATRSLAHKIASRLIKPDVLQQTNVSLVHLLEDKANYLPFSGTFIGIVTKSLLNRLLNQGDISQTQWNLCIEGAIAFYKHSLKYVF